MVSYGALLFGTAIAATVAVVAYSYDKIPGLSPKSFHPKKLQTTKSKRKIQAPSLSKKTLVMLLQTLATQMGSIIMQIAQLEEKIRLESSKTNNQLPEDKLAAYLMTQFEKSMKDIEKQVYESYKTSEKQVKYATEYYKQRKDKDVMTIVGKLDQLYSVMTGGSSSDVPKEFTLEKIITILKDSMESMNIVMEEICEEVKKLPSQEREEALRTLYSQRSKSKTLEVYAKYGATSQIIHAGSLKYKHHPEFVRACQELQKIQTARFGAAAATIFEDPINEPTKFIAP